MQPQFPQGVPRQRPLQKSMFLPQTQQFTQRSNQSFHYNDMMKRSAILTDNLKPINFQENQKSNNYLDNSKQQQNFQYGNYTPTTPGQFNNSQVLSFHNGIRYKENQRIGHNQHQQQQQGLIQQLQQHNNQSNNNQMITQSNLMSSSHSQPQLTPSQQQMYPETALQQLQQKLIQLTLLVQHHDQLLKKRPISPPLQKQHLHQLSQQLQHRLKQSIIPTLINKQTKEIFEHIFDFKLQIKTIKQQITSINENFRTEIATIVNTNKSNSTLNSSEKIEKSQLLVQPNDIINNNPIHDNILLLIDNKVSDVQRMFTSKTDQLRTFLSSEFQKAKNQLKNIDTPSSRIIRSSLIKTTLSPIMIEYRQVFAVKNNGEKHTTKINAMKVGKDQVEIVVSASTYFVDGQGYLLDNQNRYLIDQKGLQIKLDERQLALLREYNVLT